MSDSFTITKLANKPDLLALHEQFPDNYPFYLETSADSINSDCPSFDILFAFPQQKLEKKFDQWVYLNDVRTDSQNFLDSFNRLWAEDSCKDNMDTELPFRGGWFMYLGYELVNEIEPGLELNHFDENLPIATAVRIPAALIYAHKTQQAYIVFENNFRNYHKQILTDIDHLQHIDCSPNNVAEFQEENPQQYCTSIDRVLRYIKDGDVFQVNLSRLWQVTTENRIVPSDLFKKLRSSNPSPFSAVARFDSTSIISSSPERLVCVEKNKIQTRPIAGTRPRGATQVDDHSLHMELKENKKEIAEHIMLVDLERNDLGRICTPGTIRVDELMTIESYAHVHHIVSNICGQLRKNVTPADVIKAVFPGGTITGCPKVRCMEIINELEHSPRSAYTGSMGYVNNNGNLDLNILIRTMIVKDRQIWFRAGGGIVADSIADRELLETRAKAKGMLLAVGAD